jgi:uncharacterized protein YceK
MTGAKMKKIALVFIVIFMSGCAYNPIQSIAPGRIAMPVDAASVAASIQQDKANYDKAYLLSAYDVAATCQKALNAPKYQVIQICIDARIAYQRLRMTYPQYNATGIDIFMTQLLNKMDALRENIKTVDVTEYGYQPSQSDYRRTLESLNEIKALIEEIHPLVSGIEQGLGA